MLMSSSIAACSLLEPSLRRTSPLIAITSCLLNLVVVPAVHVSIRPFSYWHDATSRCRNPIPVRCSS